jgi:hypothetical protein
MRDGLAVTLYGGGETAAHSTKAAASSRARPPVSLAVRATHVSPADTQGTK